MKRRCVSVLSAVRCLVEVALVLLLGSAAWADGPTRAPDNPLFWSVPVSLSPDCGLPLGDCAHFDAIALKVGTVSLARANGSSGFADLSGLVLTSISFLDLVDVGAAFGGHMTHDESGAFHYASMPGYLHVKLRGFPAPWSKLTDGFGLQVAIAYQHAFVGQDLGKDEPPGFATDQLRVLSSRSFGPVDLDLGVGAGWGHSDTTPDLRRYVELQGAAAIRLFGLARPITPEEQLRIHVQALYRFSLPGDASPADGYVLFGFEEKTHSGYRFGVSAGPYLLGSHVGGIGLFTFSVAWGPRYRNPLGEYIASRPPRMPRSLMDLAYIDPVLEADGCIRTDPASIRIVIKCVGHPDPSDPKTILLDDGRRLAVGTHLWIRDDGMLITQRQEEVTQVDANTAKVAIFVQRLIHKLHLMDQREGKPCKLKADFLYGAQDSAFAPVLGFPSEGGMGALLGQTLDRWITCGPGAAGKGPLGLPPLFGALALGKGPGRPLRIEVTDPDVAEHTQPVQAGQSPLGDKARSHIFYGNINKDKSTGWHYEPSADRSKGTYVIEETRIAADKHGVYEANVVIEGVAKKARSSFFPKNWSQSEVENAILEAYENRSALPKGPPNRFEGRCSQGIRIQMDIDGDGRIQTAFPVAEREEP